MADMHGTRGWWAHTYARGSMYYAGGDGSDPVLSGAGCGVREDRRNSCRVFARQEELRLDIVCPVNPPPLHLVCRKNPWHPGIYSCQPAIRIRNVCIPDQNETGPLRKNNNTQATRSGRGMFRLGMVYGRQYSVRDRNGLVRAALLTYRAGATYTTYCVQAQGVGPRGAAKSGGGMFVSQIPLPDSRVFLEFVTILP